MSIFQSRLVLGGASLGKLEIANVSEILQLAHDFGIREIDTSPTYGKIESMLGSLVGDDNSWKMTTKIGNSDHSDFYSDNIIQQVAKSLSALKRDSVETICVHSIPFSRVSHQILLSLKFMREEGLARSLGYSSTSNPDDLRKAMDSGFFDNFQMTCNPLDQEGLNFLRITPEGQFQFKRVLGSGVLKTDVIDDFKLQIKTLLRLKNRFEYNDYHFRFTKIFGFYKNKSEFKRLFLFFALSQGITSKIIVGVSNTRHLRELVDLEQEFKFLQGDEFIELEESFKRLKDEYKWSPQR